MIIKHLLHYKKKKLKFVLFYVSTRKCNFINNKSLFFSSIKKPFANFIQNTEHKPAKLNFNKKISKKNKKKYFFTNELKKNIFSTFYRINNLVMENSEHFLNFKNFFNFYKFKFFFKLRKVWQFKRTKKAESFVSKVNLNRTRKKRNIK